MDRRHRRLLALLLLLCLLCGISGQLRQWQERRQTFLVAQTELQAALQAAAAVELPAGELAGQPEAAELFLQQLDLASLRQQGTEVVGWLCLPALGISQPLVQGADNSYYLDHSWRGEESRAGAVFIECENAADGSEFNTLIYGHNWQDGQMFAPLPQLARDELWEDQPRLYLRLGERLLIYDLFAVFEARVTDITYALGISSDADQQAFIDHSLNRRQQGELVPQVGCRIVTLSTCNGGGAARRLVVQALLAEELELKADGA